MTVGEQGFCVEIDLTSENDRKYILDLISIAFKQFNCGMYHGVLSREELNHMVNLVTLK